jgi:mono/diheme cytochrome c family protein
MKRAIALALTVLLASAFGRSSPGNTTNDDHRSALAAVANIEVERAEIVRTDDTRPAGHPALLHAAQRALDAAVVPSDDTINRAADGDPGDDGPIGDVDRFMDRHARARVVALDAPVTMLNSASYTTAQAKAGLTVYAANCQSCHGADLNGGSAPAVAGTEFLTTVKTAKWTLTDLRNYVVKVMPLYVPATLTPEQYANVVAFLLASNCYPAGNIPFPQKDEPAFGMVRLGPVAGAQPTNPKLGTCVVKQSKRTALSIIDASRPLPWQPPPIAFPDAASRGLRPIASCIKARSCWPNA